MLPYLLYFAIILAYVPGLYAIVKLRLLTKLPVIAMFFIGLFSLNAAGSILVFTSRANDIGLRIHPDLMNSDGVIMMIGQAIIAYACLGPYVRLRKNVLYSRTIRPGDREMLYLVGFAILLIVAIYYLQVGDFLIFKKAELISLNRKVDIGRLRNDALYGRSDAQFYAMGFSILPLLLSIHIVLLSTLRGKFTYLDGFLITLFVAVPSLLMGFKTGLMELFLAAGFAYIFVKPLAPKGQGGPLTRGQKLRRNLKRTALFIAVITPTIYLYRQDYGDNLQLDKIFSQMLFRTFGVYSLQIQVLPAYVGAHGYLNGATWYPLNLFLGNGSDISVDNKMAKFMYGSFGATPLPAFGDGYANFGWYGFVFQGIFIIACLVVIQEIFIWIDMGIFGHSVMLLYGFFAFKLSELPLFGLIFRRDMAALFLFLLFVRVLLGQRDLSARRDLPRFPPPRGKPLEKDLAPGPLPRPSIPGETARKNN